MSDFYSNYLILEAQLNDVTNELKLVKDLLHMTCCERDRYRRAFHILMEWELSIAKELLGDEYPEK